MTLSEELSWRGFINQTTYKDISCLDDKATTFYFGVDPSADSMQIGNLAAAMMVKTFAKHGHKAVLLVGGATGMVGDPDGKAQERELMSLDQISSNKNAIAAQYKQIFANYKFKLVDNYDWFNKMNYLNFLREIGKHVPMRQMLSRDFVQSRLSEEGGGISYAEFSYVLIQAYDFLYLNKNYGVSLQLCGSDQWGNSIAGVDLIRRVTGAEANVFSMPLIINRSTGKKFGKTEQGAIWLDAKKTSPTKFYQFWVNVDDEGVGDYLKVYTELTKPQIDNILEKHASDMAGRYAQTRLAEEVTKLIHGTDDMKSSQAITNYLIGKLPIGEITEPVLSVMQKEIPTVYVSVDTKIVDALFESGLTASKNEARRLLDSNSISINGRKVNSELFDYHDFQNGHLLLRRGKAFKDSALVMLKK